MSVQFLEGDLFLSDAQTIAHGCNCRGRMGAGIAAQVKAMHPEMFQEYRRRCHKGELQPGGHYLYRESIPWVLNLATQDTSGGARIEFVERCFEDFVDYYEEEGITSLAMPRIAAGLGRLEWVDVKALICDALGPLPIPVYVYEEFQRGLKAKEGSGVIDEDLWEVDGQT